MARLTQREPDRWGGIAASWRDAWWRQTIHGVLHTEADLGRMRLNRGHRALGKRGWNEAIQKQSDRGNRARKTAMLGKPMEHATPEKVHDEKTLTMAGIRSSG